MITQKEESDSDEEKDEKGRTHIPETGFINRFFLDHAIVSKEDQEKMNDDLLYDPDEEEEDEKWMNNERLKYARHSVVSLMFIYKYYCQVSRNHRCQTSRRVVTWAD